MNHCGLDLGKKYSHFCIIDDKRNVVREGRVRTRAGDLRKLLAELEPMQVVIEASTKAFWVADRISELGHKVVVADPGKTKAIGSGLIKHDKLDARILATLSHADVIARVEAPPERVRIDRMPVVVRDGLVRARTALMNMVRSVLDSEGIEVPSAAADRFVDAVYGREEGLPTGIAEAIDPALTAIQTLNEQIARHDAMIREMARTDPVMKRLQSVPGVGPITAAVYTLVIMRPERFDSARQVGAYLGLVPSLYASGQTYRLGRVTKRGNRSARYLLTMAANSLMRSKTPSALRTWGLGLADRIGRKKAVVAVARKLAGVMWAMWRDGRTFEARLPAEQA